MKQFYIRESEKKYTSVDVEDGFANLRVCDLENAIQEYYGFSEDQFYVYDTETNRTLRRDLYLEDISGKFLGIHHRLLGGKGGFGSLLRSKTSQGKKVRDFGACRDLHGRRIRHSEAQNRVDSWEQRKEEEKTRLEEELAEAERVAANKNNFEAPTNGKSHSTSNLASKMDKLSSSISSSLKMRAAMMKKKKQEKESRKRDAAKSSEDLEEELSKEGVTGVESSRKHFKEEEANKNKSVLTSSTSGQETESKTSTESETSTKKKEDEEMKEEANSRETMSSSKNSSTSGNSNDESTNDKENTEEASKSNSGEKPKSEEKTVERTYAVIDLSKLSDVSELQKFDAEHLKAELKRLGLKCGGTPLMRAQRLWMLKNSTIDQLPKKVFAK